MCWEELVCNVNLLKMLIMSSIKLVLSQCEDCTRVMHNYKITINVKEFCIMIFNTKVLKENHQILKINHIQTSGDKFKEEKVLLHE